MVDVFSLSAADFLDRWFESQELKATLVTDGVIGAITVPYSPGTALCPPPSCFWRNRWDERERGGWAYVRGGMGAPVTLSPMRAGIWAWKSGRKHLYPI